MHTHVATVGRLERRDVDTEVLILVHELLSLMWGWPEPYIHDGYTVIWAGNSPKYTVNSRCVSTALAGPTLLI